MAESIYDRLNIIDDPKYNDIMNNLSSIDDDIRNHINENEHVQIDFDNKTISEISEALEKSMHLLKEIREKLY